MALVSQAKQQAGKHGAESGGIHLPVGAAPPQLAQQQLGLLFSGESSSLSVHGVYCGVSRRLNDLSIKPGEDHPPANGSDPAPTETPRRTSGRCSTRGGGLPTNYREPGHNAMYDLIWLRPEPRHQPGLGEKAQIRVQVKSRCATDCDRGFPV